MKVIVDTAGDILYKSFYVFGLEQLFGTKNVVFSNKPFLEMPEEMRFFNAIHFIVEKAVGRKRYVISLEDVHEINKELYDWCDVYGSVNANFGMTPEQYRKKLVSLCPGFGIRCWSFPQTVVHAIEDYSAELHSFRKWIGKHKRMYIRVPYSKYSNSSQIVDDHYVFMLSTLWYSNEWNNNDEGVNARRADFIRACRAADVVFEGGLVSQGKDRSSEQLFSDFLCKGMSASEWLEKTKRSALVFNTPAFWDCHGWKLGEYLALGKAIVSTPLSNDLPAPLEHGKHIHIVENSVESMKEAIEFIVKHPKYRMDLEKASCDYWERYGTPIASLKLLGVE